MIRKYKAIKRDGGKETTVSSDRSFCSNCSTMLWLFDEHWPELIHPFASAIDTALPEPKEMVCIMGESKPKWARWPEGKKEVFAKYPDMSLEAWHKAKGMYYE